MGQLEVWIMFLHRICGTLYVVFIFQGVPSWKQEKKNYENRQAEIFLFPDDNPLQSVCFQSFSPVILECYFIIFPELIIVSFYSAIAESETYLSFIKYGKNQPLVFLFEEVGFNLIVIMGVEYFGGDREHK